MSVIYSTPVKVARMSDVMDAVDAQATHGSLVLYASDNTIIASLPLATPSGAIVSSGTVGSEDVDYVITCPLAASTAVAGTLAYAGLVDGQGMTIVKGLTVGTSNANVVLNLVDVVVGANVQITSATIRHG